MKSSRKKGSEISQAQLIFDPEPTLKFAANAMVRPYTSMKCTESRVCIKTYWIKAELHDKLQTDHNHPNSLWESQWKCNIISSPSRDKASSLCLELLGHKTCFNQWDRKKNMTQRLEGDFTLHHSPLLFLEARYHVTTHKRILRKLENKKISGGKLSPTRRQPFSKSGC